MKRTLFVISTALFLILGLNLIAYGRSDLREATPSPIPITVTTAQLFGEATSSPTPAKDPVAGEKTTVDVIPSPAPAGDLIAGEKIFARACRVCHSKDMIQNEFVAGKTDRELVEFIKIGGVPDEPLVMLPKGGNSWLTDENLHDIVAYIRSLQK